MYIGWGHYIYLPAVPNSDGVTRSGVFCAAMASIERCKMEGVVDVFQAVRALRQQQPGAILLLDHYRLIHELVLTFLRSSQQQL